MSKIRVRTSIVFEVEYYINTDFYDSDIIEEVIAQEQAYTDVNPDVMIDVLKHRGNFCGTVELVEEND